MPIPTLLARIRRLIAPKDNHRYTEIVVGFGNGILHPPIAPMSDAELGAAVAEFMKARSSPETMDRLARRFDRK